MLDKIHLINGEYAVSGEMMHWSGEAHKCVVCERPTNWYNDQNVAICSELCIERLSQKYWPEH